MEIKQPQPIIFVITGKARHGKDTVSDLIQEIYEKMDKNVKKVAYGSHIKRYAKEISDWDGDEETKPREFLQQLGTEIIRKKISPMFLVDLTMNDIRVFSFFYDVLVISDARMPEEIDIPKKIFDDVTVLKVVRPNFDNDLTIKQQKHYSEIALDNYSNYDYIIENDGTIEDLKKKLEKIIKEK